MIVLCVCSMHMFSRCSRPSKNKVDIQNHNLHTDLMICRLGTTIRLLQEGEEAWIPKI